MCYSFNKGRETKANELSMFFDVSKWRIDAAIEKANNVLQDTGKED